MRISLLAIASLFACGTAFAGDPSGYDVAKRAYDDQSGFVGQRFDSIMELYDASGKKTVSYKMKQFSVEGTSENGNVTKSLIRFISPPDSKGTALLTHENKKSGSQSRWLYLAETRQVKQIAGASQSASFKGSEVSYEDLASEVLDKYDYKNLGTAKVGDQEVWKVEAKPKFTDSGYSKIIAYYSKKHGYGVKTEYYDKSGTLLKVGMSKDYKKIKGKWRVGISQVVNMQTKKRTILKMGNFKLGIKLGDRMFKVSQLQKN